MGACQGKGQKQNETAQFKNTNLQRKQGKKSSITDEQWKQKIESLKTINSARKMSMMSKGNNMAKSRPSIQKKQEMLDNIIAFEATAPQILNEQQMKSSENNFVKNMGQQEQRNQNTSIQKEDENSSSNQNQIENEKNMEQILENYLNNDNSFY